MHFTELSVILIKPTLLFVAMATSIVACVSPVNAKDLVISGQSMFTSVVCEEVITRGLAHVGIGVQYRRYPSTRSLITSNSGEHDGETCRIKGAEKNFKNLVMISPAIMNFKAGVFVNRLNFKRKISSWDELNGVEIGIRRGHLFYDASTRHLDKTKITKVATDKQLLDMLEIGHIPVAVLILYDALEIIANNPGRYKNIMVANVELESHDVHLYIHTSKVARYSEISKGIHEVVGNGDAKEIRERAESQFSELLRRLTLE